MKVEAQKYSLIEFENLNEYDRAIHLFTSSDVIQVVKKTDAYYSLYPYQNFFVEVKFGLKDFQIIHVQSFSSANRLKMYLNEIELPKDIL